MGGPLAKSLVLALIGTFALCAPALAGGFAVTTFDQLPAGLRAEETYQLGYTVRQHGVTPLTGIATRIVAQSTTTGETVAFDGIPRGEPGHYVAEVRIARQGVWQWRVEQGPFGPQQLGSISVSEPAAAQERPDASSGASVLTRANPIEAASYARELLPAAAAVASFVFVWRLALLARSVAARRHVQGGAAASR